MVFLMFLAGCADIAPVPGGTDSINISFYGTKEELLARLTGLVPGTPEKEEDDTSREDVLHALYGYRLNYKNVKRRHGFSSPIRVRTDEKGFSYAVTLIFYEGWLFEKPIVTGGVINESSSATIFDFLNLGTVVDRTGR